MTHVTILDYGGNIRSVERACQAAGMRATVSDDHAIVASAERLILPGVGHAGDVMRRLESTGLAEAVRMVVQRGAPVLGICVGAQLLLDRSEEGDTTCFGFIEGTARKMPQLHVAWAPCMVVRHHVALNRSADVYFTHGYSLAPDNPQDRIAESAHGGEPFCCAIGKGNVVGVLWHPEKSGAAGVEVLRRFGEWQPPLATLRGER